MSRGYTPRHAQTAGDLGFAVQFNDETPWHFCSSAILGSDSPQSNNRKDNPLWVTPFIPRERPNVKHAIAGYLRQPRPTSAPALIRVLHWLRWSGFNTKYTNYKSQNVSARATYTIVTQFLSLKIYHVVHMYAITV